MDSVSRMGKAAGKIIVRIQPIGTIKEMWRFGGQRGQPTPTGRWNLPVDRSALTTVATSGRALIKSPLSIWGQLPANCYQRGQKLRACDGQSLYLAERVDAVVLEVVHDIFRRIQQEPYDRSIEQKLRQENGERERQKQAAEKKIKAAQYKQKRYEDEVIRCLDGQSRFSEEMLARLIAEAETEVRQAKEEYAELLRNDTTRATIQQIRSYYDEFLGWANEFDLATIPRKRAILGQLIEKVEVGKGYKVTVHLRMSYAQFLGIEGNGEIQVRKDVCA